jgi:hypothetical protein
VPRPRGGRPSIDGEKQAFSAGQFEGRAFAIKEAREKVLGIDDFECQVALSDELGASNDSRGKITDRRLEFYEMVLSDILNALHDM